jgi:curved DNA-binding protein CbpA
MINPYETLGLSRQANDEEIRARYLELVRQFPPDRAPERFAAVRSAYEQLRDPAVRVASLLFDRGGEESIPGMVADIRQRLITARLPTKTLLALAKP